MKQMRRGTGASPWMWARIRYNREQEFVKTTSLFSVVSGSAPDPKLIFRIRILKIEIRNFRKSR